MQAGDDSRIYKLVAYCAVVILLVGGGATGINLIRQSRVPGQGRFGAPVQAPDRSSVPTGVENGVIAYASIVDQGVFRTIQSDGSASTVAHVDVPGFVGIPSWSPDGTRLAVAVTSFDNPHPEGGNSDIYTAKADGSDSVRLTSEKVDGTPAWSPDGTTIAYVHGSNQIWVMNAGGSNPRMLTDGTSPSWSPDGTRLAFVRNLDIYTMAADGSDVSNLTNDPAFEDQPAWSPDGRLVAYTREGEGDPGIYVAAPDGSGVRELLPDPIRTTLGMAWSPDGSDLAVMSIKGPSNDRTLNILDLGTGDLTPIGEPGAWYGASWQPLPGGALRQTRT